MLNEDLYGIVKITKYFVTKIVNKPTYLAHNLQKRKHPIPGSMTTVHWLYYEDEIMNQLKYTFSNTKLVHGGLDDFENNKPL